jgi:hypothetical protein
MTGCGLAFDAKKGQSATVRTYEPEKMMHIELGQTLALVGSDKIGCQSLALSFADVQ